MDKQGAEAPLPTDLGPTAEVDDGFDFEIEDVTELDIFAPTHVVCSSTCSSSSSSAVGF